MIASGCALLLRGRAVRAAGGFDESFFCYCDDVELCLRLNLLGYETWYAPDAPRRRTISPPPRARRSTPSRPTTSSATATG